MSDEEILTGLRLIGKGTSEQVASAIVRSYTAVRKRLLKLAKEGRVFVCEWAPSLGQAMPIWREGKGKTPPRMTRSESLKAWALAHPEEAARQAMIRTRASREINHRRFLATDHRTPLERAICPNLSALPQIPYARPAA